MIDKNTQIAWNKYLSQLQSNTIGMTNLILQFPIYVAYLMKKNGMPGFSR